MIMRLKRHTLLTITKETIFEVPKVMGGVARARIRIDWFDGIIRKINEEQECEKFV